MIGPCHASERGLSGPTVAPLFILRLLLPKAPQCVERPSPCCTEVGPEVLGRNPTSLICYLGDMDVAWASERQRPVRRRGSDENFGHLGLVGARSFLVTATANHTVRVGRHFNAASYAP